MVAEALLKWRMDAKATASISKPVGPGDQDLTIAHDIVVKKYRLSIQNYIADAMLELGG